jgi:hypothetical protein
MDGRLPGHFCSETRTLSGSLAVMVMAVRGLKSSARSLWVACSPNTDPRGLKETPFWLEAMGDGDARPVPRLLRRA